MLIPKYRVDVKYDGKWSCDYDGVELERANRIVNHYRNNGYEAKVDISSKYDELILYVSQALNMNLIQHEGGCNTVDCSCVLKDIKDLFVRS